jgi:hypothetical protein
MVGMLIKRQRRSVFRIIDLAKKPKCTRHDYKALSLRSAERRIAISNDFARDISEAIDQARASGATNLDAIAEHLNNAGHKTLRGGVWRGNQVKRQLARLRND